MDGLNVIPVNYVMDALFIHDAEPGYVGRFLEANSIACERSGYTRDELLQMTPLDLDDKNANVDIGPVVAQLAKGETVLFEQVHITKDGRRIPVEIHARPVMWEGRRAVVSMIRDISARRRAEAALRLSEESFRTAFDNAVVGTVLVSPTGYFLQVNRTFARMLGYSPVELIGKNVSDVTLTDDSSKTDKLFNAVLMDGAPFYKATKRYLHRDGHVIWGEVSAALLRNPDGSPSHLVAQVLDLTDRIQADDVIRQNQAHLERMVEERTKKLQESNSALQSFAYAASHDLREPLIKITAFGQRLEERYAPDLDAKGKQYLEIMQSAATRMLSLIDDLLAYSRVGREDAPIVEVDVSEVLQDVVSDLEVSIQASGATVEISGELPVVRAHTVRIRQVFQNLISNAIKFRKPGVPPVVKIMGHLDNKDGIITVEDNGIGFDPQYAEKIFTIFTRLHTRFEYPGTGVGLAICRRVIDQYGGSIKAMGKVGVGSTFTLQIPTADSINRVRTLVLVDDHEVVLRGLETVIDLERDLRIIGEASEAKTAIELVRRLNPDAVVMDAGLPGGMDGIAATHQITGEFPKTVVIGLSVGPHDIVGPLMLRAGAKQYIRKDQPLREVVVAIKRVLNESEGRDGCSTPGPVRGR